MAYCHGLLLVHQTEPNSIFRVRFSQFILKNMQTHINLSFAKKTSPVIGGDFMSECLFKYDNDTFGIEIYNRYVNLRWKKQKSQISYEAIKRVVDLIKSLNKKQIG